MGVYMYIDDEPQMSSHFILVSKQSSGFNKILGTSLLPWDLLRISNFIGEVQYRMNKKIFTSDLPSGESRRRSTVFFPPQWTNWERLAGEEKVTWSQTQWLPCHRREGSLNLPPSARDASRRAHELCFTWTCMSARDVTKVRNTGQQLRRNRERYGEILLRTRQDVDYRRMEANLPCRTTQSPNNCELASHPGYRWEREIHHIRGIYCSYSQYRMGPT